MKLTKARLRILTGLAKNGEDATPAHLGYPRSNMMHEMYMLGWICTSGKVNSWGVPIYPDGVYRITAAGRRALSRDEGRWPWR